MATLILGAFGTLVGGPIGGAIGALAGRQLDAQLIGPPTREGPRLRDLAVSASSYGQPIARHYGQVRAPGTFIWATDLAEHRETRGGGKGKPKLASYTYSVSFAVALSSRPIDRIGRIWADGNLLRGAAGDLKAAGTLRIHTGHADQDCDPLLKAHLGAECPAHRGCAYAVFEDLQLADFGNRIPALSFEVFAGSGAALVEALIEGEDLCAVAQAPFPELAGYSYEGGTLGQLLALTGRLRPIVPDGRTLPLTLRAADTMPGAPIDLPAPSRWGDGEFGRDDGVGRARQTASGGTLSALRYYDLARDYQPSLQRAEGRSPLAQGHELEFPGTFAADDARRLVRDAARRDAARCDTLAWRVAELDPSLKPGTIVRAPGEPGLWQVAAWEWREGGIELQLLRHLATAPSTSTPGDAGRGWVPPDRLSQPSHLRVFEAPWDGTGAADTRRIHAAVSAASGRWGGAALYLDQQGALAPTGHFITDRAVSGQLAQALHPSQALLFEPTASAMIALIDNQALLPDATLEALASGANRLLIGAEIVQFARAEPLGDGLWQLHGLLRGRGATEGAALAGHAAGAPVTLLDERLVVMDAELSAGSGAPRFAALGHADASPVMADTESPGASRKPPVPVHPHRTERDDGSLTLGWTRRARGGWVWLDEVEQPLVEQVESYEIGMGPVDAPFATWLTGTPTLTITAAARAALAQDHPGATLWVRQCGSFARSDPLLLGPLA